MKLGRRGARTGRNGMGKGRRREKEDRERKEKGRRSVCEVPVVGSGLPLSVQHGHRGHCCQATVATTCLGQFGSVRARGRWLFYEMQSNQSCSVFVLR